MAKIVIIGANNFQLPLIKQAKDMGLETHVFAWDHGAVGKAFADYFYPISIIEKEQILIEAGKIKPQAVISIGSDLAAITVNYVAHYLGLIGNSLGCTELSTNKYLMRTCLKKNGILCPQFKKVNQTSECDDLFEKFPLVVKPTDRSGSRGVTKVNSIFELNEAIQRALNESFSGECIVEEFIAGKEYSVEMISWKGNHWFIQITEKETTGAPYFVEIGQHQPAQIEPNLLGKIIAIVEKSLVSLGVENGASHSELMITGDNDIYIIEIGARMGGDYIGSHLVPLSTGINFMQHVVDISLGSFKGCKSAYQYFSGIYYLTPKPGKVSFIVDNTEKYSDIVFKELYCKPDDIITEVKESSERSGCYIYQSKMNKFRNNDSIFYIETKNFS